MALWLQLSQFLELIFYVSNCVMKSNFRCLYFCTTQICRLILPWGFQYIPHPSINRCSLKKGRLAVRQGGPWKFTLNELITAPIWHCMPATENEALIAPSRHDFALPLELTWNKKALFVGLIDHILIWISLYYRNQSYLPLSSAEGDYITQFSLRFRGLKFEVLGPNWSLHTLETFNWLQNKHILVQENLLTF